MSLNLSRVEKLVELGDGMKRGRCPACAESGGDRKGQHLRIYPDGKFGCCVHPADNEHRKRIFALVGERKPRGIVVRVATPTPPQIRRGILKALTVQEPEKPDAPDGANEMQSAECRIQNEKQVNRTGRTGGKESQNEDGRMENVESYERTGRTGQADWTGELFTEVRTLRTPQYSLRGTTADNKESENDVYILKGFADPVRCVRGDGTDETNGTDGKGRRLPHLTASGDLCIPFDSPERYHWWKPPHDQRLRVSEILAEIRGRKENDASPF